MEKTLIDLFALALMALCIWVFFKVDGRMSKAGDPKSIARWIVHGGAALGLPFLILVAGLLLKIWITGS